MPIRCLEAEIEVRVPPEGVFANAFRIQEDDQGYLLDFLVYSPTENKAYVVARVRVAPELISLMVDQTTSALVDRPGEVLFLADG